VSSKRETAEVLRSKTKPKPDPGSARTSPSAFLFLPIQLSKSSITKDAKRTKPKPDAPTKQTRSRQISQAANKPFSGDASSARHQFVARRV
jgi:hypothetical protein